MAIFGPRVGHEALFDEICRFNEIDRKSRQLLQTVIKKYQLAQPAKMFFEPETLMHAMSDADFSDESENLQQLYDAWFIDRVRR
jgi:1,2-phenylacetyl-CoA epoxidase catalytic subunit